MHSGNIEDYSFTHGLQKNVVNGKWFPLHPHTLGRALTHDEMDYNLLYSQQTMAGFRIFGQNEDLTLHDNELSKSLIFWKISLDDIDYLRYNDKNYHVGQYIWITPLFDCNDFVITLSSTTKTSLAYPRYVNLTSINNSVDEGGQIVFKLSTKHIPHGTTIGYTITGSASFSSDYQKLGGGLLEINSSSEGARGYVTITGDLTLITLNTTADSLTENNEFLLLTLDPTDSISTVAGLTHSVGINDTSVGPGPTPTSVPVATATPMPTATVEPVPTPTAIPNPTATAIPDPTATPVPTAEPTATPVPTAEPTATPVPDPTATDVPDPTATPVPTATPSATAIPTLPVYYFHLGTNGYPWGRDLINDTLYLSNDDVVANYAESFEDMLANPGSYEPVGQVNQLINGTTFTMEASSTANFYWIAIPASLGIPDLTVNPRIEISGAPADVCSAKLAFIRNNGAEYTLYKLNTVPTAGSVEIRYAN